MIMEFIASVSMQSDFISKRFRSTATNEENTIYPSYFQLLLLVKKVRNTKSEIFIKIRK